MGRAYQNRKDSMAKTSDQKARVYSKYAREIYVSAKEGGFDPGGNLALRSIIDRAKKDQVPTHVIDKAIDKARGGGGEDFALARYEGFGPGGVTVIVDCLTDNPNRTFGDVRLCFNKAKSKIGAQGSVSHMFDHSAIFMFSHDDEDAVLETLMMVDADVTDIESDLGKVTIFAPHTEYAKVRQALIEAFGDLDFDVDDIQFVPHNVTPLGEEEQQALDAFVDALDYLEDVQKIYHSAG